MMYSIQLTKLIKDQLPWNSASSLLFDSICEVDNPSCPRLLRGAFTRGLQVARIEYAYQTISTLNQVTQSYESQRYQILRSVSELMIAYEDYLRPQL
mgnify:FL=1